MCQVIVKQFKLITLSNLSCMVKLAGARWPPNTILRWTLDHFSLPLLSSTAAIRLNQMDAHKLYLKHKTPWVDYCIQMPGGHWGEEGGVSSDLAKYKSFRAIGFLSVFKPPLVSCCYFETGNEVDYCKYTFFKFQIYTSLVIQEWSSVVAHFKGSEECLHRHHLWPTHNPQPQRQP